MDGDDKARLQMLMEAEEEEQGPSSEEEQEEDKKPVEFEVDASGNPFGDLFSKSKLSIDISDPAYKSNQEMEKLVNTQVSKRIQKRKSENERLASSTVGFGMTKILESLFSMHTVFS